MNKKPFLFVQNQYEYLIIQGRQQESVLIDQFANQEFFLKISSYQEQSSCLIIASMTAPADEVLQVLLLAHTLQQYGVGNITLFCPYLGYQRQDRLQDGFSAGLQWADAMVHAAGVRQIITIEPHAMQSLTSLKVPVYVHSSELFFAQDMEYFVGLGFSFIFPDAGAVGRCDWIFKRFAHVAYGFFSKQRIHGMIEFTHFQGKISKKVMIVDDILDSGQTLVQLSIILRHMGVEEIVIFVTHAFFHGQVWHDLWSLGVQYIYCTDSLPRAHHIQHPQIRCTFISFLLQNYY